MRIGYIDNLRGILMVLGIVLHSAAVFSTQKYWLVSYEHSSVYLDWINVAIHTFRMPLFFMIAGFFAIMLLKKYRFRAFMLSRVKRLLIPLSCAALFINTTQNYLLTSYYNDESNYFVQYYLSHLWFLINLIVYCALLTIIYALLSLIKADFNAVNTRYGFWLTLVIFPFVFIALLALGKLGAPIYQNIIIVGMPIQLMYYGSFFFFGTCFFIHTTWLQCIEKGWITWLALSLCTTIARLTITFDKDLISLAANEYLNVFHVLIICICVWGLFAKLVHKQYLWLNKVSEASYTIYLFHHLLIVAIVIGVNTTGLKVPTFVLFILLVSSVYILTWYLHFQLIARNNLLSQMFNGSSPNPNVINKTVDNNIIK